MTRIDEHFHFRAGKTYNSCAVMAYYLQIHADVNSPYCLSAALRHLLSLLQQHFRINGSAVP